MRCYRLSYATGREDYSPISLDQYADFPPALKDASFWASATGRFIEVRDSRGRVVAWAPPTQPKE